MPTIVSGPRNAAAEGDPTEDGYFELMSEELKSWVEQLVRRVQEWLAASALELPKSRSSWRAGRTSPLAILDRQAHRSHDRLRDHGGQFWLHAYPLVVHCIGHRHDFRS